MCVIVYKPKGVSLDFSILEECFASNRDGAGYMYREDGQIYASKGHMTILGLYDALINDGLLDSNDKLTSHLTMGLHFRIATHGGICAENTHPFPLSSEVDRLKMLNWIGKVGIMHNGILSGYDSKGELSDTQQFVKEILGTKIIRKNINNQGILKLIDKSIGSSKFLIMNHESAWLLGKWINDLDCYFSNDSYVYVPPAKKGVSSYWNGKKWVDVEDKWGSAYSSYYNSKNTSGYDYYDYSTGSKKDTAISSSTTNQKIINQQNWDNDSEWWKKKEGDSVVTTTPEVEDDDDLLGVKVHDHCYFTDDCRDCPYFEHHYGCGVWDKLI